MADHKRHAGAGYELLDETAYDHSVARTRSQQARAVVAAVERAGPSGPRRWVDVGCGPGVLLAAVREAGFETVGLEPDPIAADQAAAAVGGLELHRMTLTDGLLPDASASVISTLDVLEHVPADELGAFAMLVRRALAPGGVWVIKLPTSEGLYFRLAAAARRVSWRLSERVLRRLWQTDYAYPHTAYFDHRSLDVFLSSAGFEAQSATYLRELPLATAFTRLRMDPTIPLAQALLALPVVALINLLERALGKTDALLMLATRDSREDAGPHATITTPARSHS